MVCVRLREIVCVCMCIYFEEEKKTIGSSWVEGDWIRNKEIKNLLTAEILKHF